MKYLKKLLILSIVLLINYNIKSSDIEIKQTVDNKSQNELNNRLWKAVEDLDLNKIKKLVKNGAEVKFLNNLGNINPESKLTQSSDIFQSQQDTYIINFLIPTYYSNNPFTTLKLKILEYLINKGLNFDFDEYSNFINFKIVAEQPSLFKTLLDKGAKIYPETLLSFIYHNTEKLDKLISDKKNQDIDYIVIQDVIYSLLIKGVSPCIRFLGQDFFDYMKESNDLRKIWKKYLNFINEIKKTLIQHGIPSRSVDQIILDYGYITNKSQC